MNEILQALETMIRRVVQEELQAKALTVPSYTADGFAMSLKNYVDGRTAEWSAIVSQGALDQPWFDDAIAAEVATSASDAVSEDFTRKLENVVSNNGVLEDWFTESFNDRMGDVSFSVSVD